MLVNRTSLSIIVLSLSCHHLRAHVLDPLATHIIFSEKLIFSLNQLKKGKNLMSKPGFSARALFQIPSTII